MSSSNMKENLIIGGVLVLLAVAIVGGYLFPASTTQVVQVGSPAGSTFNTAKVAAVNITPSSASATSSSVYNGDTSDRIVTDAFVSCSSLTNVYTAVTGAGLASAGWLWTAATTSTNAPAVIRTGSDLAMNVSVATTTASDAYTATTTYTLPYTRRWAAGTYMTFQPNATSSSAVCQAGVHYLAL